MEVTERTIGVLDRLRIGVRRYWIPLVALGVTAVILAVAALIPGYTRFVTVRWNSLECVLQTDGTLVVLLGVRQYRAGFPIDRVLLTESENLTVLGAAVWPSDVDGSAVENPPSDFSLVNSRGWLSLDEIDPEGAMLAVLVEVTGSSASADGLEVQSSGEIVMRQRIAVDLRADGQTCSVVRGD